MTDQQYQLMLRSAGMFSNVNEVVHHLYLAEKLGYRFRINWSRSCYFEKGAGHEPWEYYFEPCYDGPWEDKLDNVAAGKVVACAEHNIITPRVRDGQCAPLLMPVDRQLPNSFIKRFIKPKREVISRIEDFIENNFGSFTIGLHLRGLGRNHGGAAAMLRNKGAKVSEIDYHRYFSHIDTAIAEHKDAPLFVCSDSQEVIDHVTQHYGERVCSYSASRSDFGEMHASHKENQGLVFSPHKLGMDVVVEAYLLSCTNLFIHGNSNVANFVVCNNPALEAIYVYQDDIAQVLKNI